MRFENKVAIITAAGNGIGRASAAIMVCEGATVVAVDNVGDKLTRLVADMAGEAGKVIPMCIDAMNADQAKGAVAETVATCGRIDILVNAVGGSTIIPKPSAGIDELTAEEWQAIIAFNLNATFHFINAVVPQMKAQGSGKIVNLASIAGRGRSVASSSAYATAKGGIIALTRKLAYELGPSGINVNAIAPSRTLTERIRPHWEQQSPEDKAAEIERVPLRRLAEAEDQAKVLCFLASTDADFVSGVTIDVTGGQ